MIAKNKTLLKKYNEKGWVKIKKFLPKKSVAKINKSLNKFLDSKVKNYSGRDINFTEKKINSFHKLADSKFVKRNLAKNKKIKKTAEYFLKEKSKFMASELFAKPAKYGLPVPNHQDNYYWCVNNANALTIWIALDKVSKLNGSICYYEKSHRFGIFKHSPSFSKGSSQKIRNNKALKNFKKIHTNLLPGDALIHHSLIVHGSERNKSGNSRRGLTLQFRAKNSFIDPKKKISYEKELKEQIKSRKSL